MRKGKNELKEKYIYKWLMKICKQNMSVKRKRKREKDLEFAKGINILDFIASEGWLNRWKKGAGLLFGLVNRGPILLI